MYRLYGESQWVDGESQCTIQLAASHLQTWNYERRGRLTSTYFSRQFAQELEMSAFW
jgi:hypothetical protein